MNSSSHTKFQGDLGAKVENDFDETKTNFNELVNFVLAAENQHTETYLINLRCLPFLIFQLFLVNH